MKLLGVTYKNNEIEDQATFKMLPEDLKAFLSTVNGFVALKGGLHLRGCVHEPKWHSIDEAWTGKLAFWKYYPDLLDTDVPFAQDCMGDQFLLRGKKIIRLYPDTGEIEELEINILDFFEAVESDPVSLLGMHPLIQYEMDGNSLQPGYLLNAVQGHSEGIMIKSIPIEEKLQNLINIYRNEGSDEEGVKFYVG